MTLPPYNGNGNGTAVDMIARLRAMLPEGWFPVSPPAPAPSTTPVLDGVLAGLAGAWSFCFSLLGTIAAQARLRTASGAFLDMISVDLFGLHLPRRTNELDDAFRRRISAGLTSHRSTRQDVYQALVELTSSLPIICEPTRGADCGGYASAKDPESGGGLGYSTLGLRYGSSSLPFQYLLNTAPRATFASGMVSVRESPATFIGADGLMQLASARVIRPDYRRGVVVGALLEPRGFNLITNSRFWNDFAQSAGDGLTETQWAVNATETRLFKPDPIMSVIAASGMRTVGPSVDLAVAGSVVTGSAWILFSTGSVLTDIELVLTDLNVAGSSKYVSADMTRADEWQRLSLSTQTVSSTGRNLRISLLMSCPGGASATIITQCWQVELGSVTSSYIPTAGSLGIREQDNVLAIDPVQAVIDLSVIEVLDGLASVIPAATIAWTTISS